MLNNDCLLLVAKSFNIKHSWLSKTIKVFHSNFVPLTVVMRKTILCTYCNSSNHIKSIAMYADHAHEVRFYCGSSYIAITHVHIYS